MLRTNNHIVLNFADAINLAQQFLGHLFLVKRIRSTFDSDVLARGAIANPSTIKMGVVNDGVLHPLE